MPRTVSTCFWQLVIEGSHLCTKFQIYLPDILQNSVIFSRSFIVHLTSQALVVIRSFIYASQLKHMHAYKLVTLRGKILLFFPLRHQLKVTSHRSMKQKKVFTDIRKELNSNRIGLVNQHGCCFIVLKHQYGSHDDIMGVRSILPLLLKKKNTMLKWSVIISGTHSFLTFFYYVAPHILSCMEFWNLNSSHYSRKVHVGGGKGGNRLAHIFSHFFPLKKSCTRAETNIFLDFQDNITSM